MSAVLAPPEASVSTPNSPDAVRGPTPRQFLTGYAWTLLVPVLALAGPLAGWALLPVAGWPAAVAAVTGWSLLAVGWLRRRRWPVARAHVVTWVGPATLLAPPAALGLLSADGLVLWGPVSAVLAVALAAVHDPWLACPELIA